MSRANSAGDSAISKSKFFSLPYTKGPSGQVGVKQYYDFISTNDENLKKVPVAITGSTNPDIFWQIGGGNMNGDLAKYLRTINPKLLQEANKKLRDEGPTKGDLKGAIGRVEVLDFTKIEGFKAGYQIEKILYSASPNLGSNPRTTMIAFGEKFRNQLHEKRVKELCLPLFSGGVYNGGNSQDKVAEWLMEGWLAAEAKTDMPGVTVYLGHQCLVDAVTAKGIQCTKHSPSATTPAVSGTKSPTPPKGGSDPKAPLTGSVKKASSGSVAKDLSSRNRGFAYSDREIDAVNFARNLQDGIFYRVLDGVTTNILSNREGHLLKEGGKTVVELPACDAIGKDSPITGHLKAQFAHLDKLERRREVIYPLKILFPYKVRGWHWNAGEIVVTDDKAGKFRIEGRAYDPVGGGTLDPKIQLEIRAFFTNQPGFYDADFRLDIKSDTQKVQKGGVACGLYAARAIHNLKTKDSLKIWDGVLVHGAIKKDQDLRDEDSALVERNCEERTKAQFCALIDEGTFKEGASKGPYKEEEEQAAAILRSIKKILGGKFNEELSLILMKIVYSEDITVGYNEAFVELATVHKNLPGIFFKNERGNRGDALFTAASIGIVCDYYSGAEAPLEDRESVAKVSSSRGPVINSSKAVGKSNASPEFDPKHVDKWSSGVPDEGGVGARSPLKTKPITPEVAKSIRRVDSEDESASVEDLESALSEDGSEDESTSYSEPILSDRVEIEGMKSIGGNKIKLNLLDKEAGNEKVVINLSENRLLEVVDSSDGGEVKINVKDFRKELMDYYKGEGDYLVGEDGKVVELKKEALEVLRIYQAVPSTSVALKSVSHIVVGNLSKNREK
jgi:hypothetical protein